MKVINAKQIELLVGIHGGVSNFLNSDKRTARSLINRGAIETVGVFDYKVTAAGYEALAQEAELNARMFADEIPGIEKLGLDASGTQWQVDSWNRIAADWRAVAAQKGK